VLAGGAVDLANDGTLNYTLSGIGGSATVALRVRDNGWNREWRRRHFGHAAVHDRGRARR
jgi:hypothetical protein